MEIVNNFTKPPAAFQVLIISKCMHGLQACLFKYITVAAFRIYGHVHLLHLNFQDSS